MRNPFRQFLDLIPTEPLQVGTVRAVANGLATIELPGGGTISARGEAVIGQNVFVRGGAIEGAAPALPIEVIEI
ncbi:hypothetical protein G8A07_15525 [Roseateles sp. DAIF2]|uniref:hypothetical protein n=1 Tax=Roseateles sp. DAIF2 TaxID=2714952 RepID=UPI0018A3062A|nr:hypothetical protein [Roseateles sp. DAIF2]QPF74185.1 hypothetical protein G8A07_15525 [Roseateles sp. DAIF2]